MFIHKHKRNFKDVRIKYHLYPNDISSDGVSISYEDVGTRKYERQSRNGYDGN